MFGQHDEPEAELLGYRIADAGQRRIALPAGTRVYDMHAEGATLWLASGRGLLRIDTSTDAVTTFVAPQPEAGRVFYSVQPDAHGALWIGSNRGLLRFDPLAEEGRRFRHFDGRDGLAISEFNRRSHAVDAQGRLLFGGIGGVVRFDPARARDIPAVPQPRVTRALVWNRDGERSVEPTAGVALTLAADDLTVALEYAAPGFRRAGHLGFRYRLDGVDAGWVDDAGARSARYPRPAPGDYVFHLQAGNNEAGWREADTPLSLRFLPAWHESWWFRLPALLTVILVIWLLYRWRLARLLEMERLRLRIAADLHDEMGSELAAIGTSASMLGQREGLGANERRRLTGVAESAQKVAESMRDIVWYVNPEKDRVTALGERLQTLARRLFGEDGVSVHNGWRDDDAGLSMAVRRELHLICREALTNARRHAEADHIELRLDRDSDGLFIEITDNGRGFV
ncbi:MAG: ATP-binding protein, partial [Xanthomonadales bacterium]|nr:ATP-binding protein [Xanthomonadales bacterium]